MTGKEAYKIWAGAAGVWAAWVRPVPFISPCLNCISYTNTISGGVDCGIDYIDDAGADCAVILDLPSEKGVYEGLSLARTGKFRPVPLYNGCKAIDGTMELVDNREIENALLKAAEPLSAVNFAKDAAPVFLLDSYRTRRFKMNVSVFDNGWDIYPQDMPSGEFLISQGIKKILVRGLKLNKDLKAVLCKYQRVGIKIFFADSKVSPSRIVFKKIKQKPL